MFLRAQEVVEVPPEAARALAGPLAALARAEGLTGGHAGSAEVRAELAKNDTPLERGAAT